MTMDLLSHPKVLLEWWADKIKIKNKAAKLVPFVPLPIQQRLLSLIVAQHMMGFPVRIIVLKHRQPGCSSFIDMLFYALVCNNPNTNAFVCAHDGNASKVLFDRIRLAHSYNPDWDEDDMMHSNAKELIWKPPHNSKFQVETAGKTTLKRSDTLTYLHPSELAFWPHDAEALNSVMSCVPEMHGTIVVIESTANGDVGEYADRYKTAESHQTEHEGALDEYAPIFFNPIEDPACYLKVPRNYKGGALDSEELQLIKDFGQEKVTREHLYWRRKVLKEKCGKNLDLFHQENPYYPGQAFLLSGRGAIPADIIQRHRKQEAAQRHTRKIGYLQWTDPSHKSVRFEEAELPEDTLGVWRIWQMPTEGWDYAMAADVALGELSDPMNHRSEPDLSAIGVLERQELKTAAEYCGRPTPHELADEMEKACIFFNRAYMTPEINNAGYSTLEKLIADGFAVYLYQRTGTIDVMAGTDPGRYGWVTDTSSNRNGLIYDWISVCRGTSGHDKGKEIICLSRRLHEEESSFVVDKRGKMQHKTGKDFHDDCLFAWMIAYRVHKTCPRTRTAYLAPMHPIDGGTSVGSYMRDGGRDDMLAELEEPQGAEELEVS